MSRSKLLLAVALVLSVAPVRADQVRCQKTLVNGLRKYKKTYLKVYQKCLEAENLGKISDLSACDLSKITLTNQKIVAKVALACPAPGDISNYPATCDFEPGAPGKEAQCAALP